MPHDATLVRMACVDDDAQGQALEVLWEREVDAEVLTGEAWQDLATKGFDQPRILVSERLLIDEQYAGPLRDWLDENKEHSHRPGSLLILDEARHDPPMRSQIQGPPGTPTRSPCR